MNELQKSFQNCFSNLVEWFFRQTPNELNAAKWPRSDGKFIAPGPGNSPDRNPAVFADWSQQLVRDENSEEVPQRDFLGSRQTVGFDVCWLRACSRTTVSLTKDQPLHSTPSPRFRISA